MKIKIIFYSMLSDLEEINRKTKGTPGGNHIYFKISHIYHMAKLLWQLLESLTTTLTLAFILF